jgi:hypothetical protein
MSSLQDDLLQEYRAERKMVYSQLEVLDPLATSLRKPAAQRLISNGALVICELLCYLLALTAIAFMVFMNKIYPFYMLNDLLYNAQSRAAFGLTDITYLNVAVYSLVTVIAILLIIVGRIVRRIRLKNNILQMAGTDIKLVVAQYLQRKAAIDAIDQRHFMELPQGNYADSVSVNDIPNAGYGA